MLDQADNEYIKEEDRVMTKIMIAAAAIILIIELIPLIIGLIFGSPISEILPIMGVMLVSQFFGVLLSYVIISIIEWALD